jgi:hypothetical protein
MSNLSLLVSVRHAKDVCDDDVEHCGLHASPHLASQRPHAALLLQRLFPHTCTMCICACDCTNRKQCLQRPTWLASSPKTMSSLSLLVTIWLHMQLLRHKQ